MVKVINHNYITYENDIRAMLQAFFPGQQLVWEEDDAAGNAPGEENPLSLTVDVDAICDGCDRSKDRFIDKSLIKRVLYKHLAVMTGRLLPWGTLTGIRPVRIVEMMLAKGLEPDAAREEIRELFLVSEEKLDLMFSIYAREQEVLGRLDVAGGYSIYINIPFCPTRCLYCSFTSNPVDRWERRIDEYLEAMRRELEQIRLLAGTAEESAEISVVAAAETTAGAKLPGRNRIADRKLQTIYVGGGTPTALSAAQLDKLLTMIEEIFGYETYERTLPENGSGGRSTRKEMIRRVPIAELTVEAGRPDSITKEKLEVLRRHGVDRISINPQTMHQKTLDLIGRRHTVEQTIEAYRLARGMGFDNINMDLIMGLPGEDLEDVCETLRQIEVLRPDSLTVHALAVKRSSRLSTEGKAWGGVARKGLDDEGMDEVADMTAMGAETAVRLGLQPYYLYRQKNMAGNQDNVGYAAPGKECVYNILMMEEKHTVIGVGAGSSTKEVSYASGIPAKKTVRRFENVKNIEDYLSRIGELLERKQAFFEESLTMPHR
ncbi:MAG: coproporphyrinogen dehydrogenase HemZ [Lachnospiraceae bacterium]|nr:coproporphyrinogen dehydrogenase HemZ [Lachnospiraceae bacterium]